MKHILFFSGTIVFALVLLWGKASPQSTPLPKGVHPHKNKQNLSGCLFFSKPDENDAKKVSIFRYDLANGSFVTVGAIPLQSGLYFDSHIAPDGRFFSVTQTTCSYGSDANLLVVYDMERKTNRSYDTGGKIASEPVYSDTKAFVTINKFGPMIVTGSYNGKPTTATLPAFHSSLVAIDLCTGAVEELKLPPTLNPKDGDYQEPRLEPKGDQGKLYFYFFATSDYDGYYSYNLKTHEYLREARHIPCHTADGRVIYFETSDRFMHSRLQPKSKRLGWRLCTFKLKEDASFYDAIGPEECAEQIELIKLYPGFYSYYNFWGTLSSGKYALIQQTGLWRNSFLLVDIASKKEKNVLDANLPYVFSGIVE